MTIPIKIEDERFLPKYQTEGSACFDLVAKIPPNIYDGVDIGSVHKLNFRQMAVIECGFSAAIPDGYKISFVARSGFASRGLVVMNAPSQIDSDYRGPLKVIVANVTGKEIIVIKDGDRFAQGFVEPVYTADWKIVDELPPTVRGEGGLGSTGV